MTDIPEPEVMATTYTVSCLPRDHPWLRSFHVKVEHRGNGRWAVTQAPYCFDADGVEQYESIPSERREEFIARFRFDLDTAMAIAKAVAPTLRSNQWTVKDALEKFSDKSAE